MLEGCSMLIIKFCETSTSFGHEDKNSSKILNFNIFLIIKLDDSFKILLYSNDKLFSSSIKSNFYRFKHIIKLKTLPVRRRHLNNF